MSYLREKLRKFGWWRFGVVAARLLWERLYRKDHYFLFRRSADSFHASKESGFRAVPITEESIARFAGTFPFRAGKFLRRLRGGLQGFFYLKGDGTPVGYNWYVVHADYYEPAYGCTIHLGEHEAYLLDGFVLPERRGSTVTGQGFAHTQRAVRDCGAKTIFSLADKNNPAGWKLHLHLGFEIVGCLEVTRFFTWFKRPCTVDPGGQMSPEILAAIKRHARRRPWASPGEPRSAGLAGAAPDGLLQPAPEPS